MLRLGLLPHLGVFRRCFGHLKPYRPSVALGLLCVVVSGTLAVLVPRLSGQVLDLARAAGEAGSVTVAAVLGASALVLAAGLGEASAGYVARKTLIDASRRVEEVLKNEIMGHVVSLPIARLDRGRTGDLISRLTQDVELLRFLVGPMLLHGGKALVVVPLGLWFMVQISPLVFVGALIAFGILVAALAVTVPRIQRDSRIVQEAIGDISQRCAEDFQGIAVITSFGRGGGELAEMRKLSERYLTHNIALTRTRAVLNLFIHSSRELVVLSVLVLGALEARAGHVTIGELFEFVLLSWVMTWPLMATSWIISYAHRAVAAAERIEAVFSTPAETRTGTRPRLRGRLEVQHLTFCYEGQSRAALADVSFVLEPGQKLGLVGPVGSGKSTLLALLLRLYDPPPGTVLVDGHDVLELDPAVLRATFAIAPQDPFLFSDTIRGNVVFGTDDGEEEVEPAVHASALEQDLPQLPAGLESVVGERGITLSGGQRQRVSLARALAANRSALVLDDTLSAVDHRTEVVILDRLRRARAGRTMVVASHRISAVADSDLILVLHDGRVVERGDHAALVARGGYYAQAWARQRERALLEGDDGA